MAEPAPERRALLLGCDEYDHPSLSQLRTARQLSELAELLGSTEIGGFTVDRRFNVTASEANKAVFELFANAGPHDLLLFYFQGHGIKDSDGALFLGLRDTDPAQLAVTALPAAFITQRGNQSRAGQIVLMVDCDYSGAFTKGAR
jgi:hypothetical protein